MTAAGLVALIGALLGAGGITALLKARSENRRTNAEAAKTNADAEVTLGGGWHVLWESARKETNELRERLALVEQQEAACRERLAKLEAHATPEKIEERVKELLDREIARRERKRA